MPQPRRRFIQQFAFASAALLFQRAHAAKAVAGTASGMAEPGYSAFSAMAGRAFSASDEHGKTVILRLARVLRPRSLAGYADVARAREQCFTLVFRTETPEPLPEGIYRLGSMGMASFDALVSPAGPAGRDGQDYQAVFNRI